MTLSLPSSFMLIAAMDSCLCGFFGDATRECRCTPGGIQRYLGKISGPLLDRIDIHVEVPAVPYKELRSTGASESSAEIRERVAVSAKHLAEAVQYRSLDRNYWS
jgi:magnesium chelatase family protein